MTLAGKARLRSRAHLLQQIVWRDLAARYRGTMCGALWLLAGPLMLLAVYWLVLEQVFQPRWSGTDTGAAPFTLHMFAGLMAFTVFGEAIARAPGLIAANESFVRKIVFPLELLPVMVVVAALMSALCQLAVLLAGHMLLVGPPPWTALLAPLALVPIVLQALGMAWLVAALGAYVRDLNHIVSPLVMAFLFLSPVLYPTTALPPHLRPAIAATPLGAGIDLMRALVLAAPMPSAANVAMATLLGLALAVAGYGFFCWVRRGFADVL